MKWLVFIVALAIAEEYTVTERACSVLAMDFLLTQSKAIETRYAKNADIDIVGIINRIALDSFEKCTKIISKEQADYVDLNGYARRFANLAEVDVMAYGSVKVEPSLDFIGKLKKIHSTAKMHKTEL